MSEYRARRAARAGVLTAALGLLGICFPGPGRAQPRATAPFKFSDVDLKLLDESNAVDHVFETRGLIYSDAVLQMRLAGIAAKYNNVLVQLRRKPNRVDKGTLTLGGGVASFEPAKDADALVLVRGSATSASPGKKATVFIGIGALSSFHGDISFVNARTGDVLAWTRISRQADVSKDAINRLAGSARTALRDIPLPVPAPDKTKAGSTP
jgi:hypothetical protein